MRKSPGYRILIWGLLIGSLILLWQLNSVFTRPKYIPIDDFVRHWASGRLWFTGADPYSPAEIQVLQDQASGSANHAAVITPNYIPPWTMPLLALFSWADYPTSRLIWLLFNIAILLFSVELLWKVYAAPPKRKWIAWIVCFSFGPAISLLGKGQTSGLILLGIAGFLFFTELKPNEWAAGAFAALITVKPQVFYLFWAALLFWVIQRRSYKIPLSCALTILAASGITLLFDPNIFGEYFRAIRDYPPSMFATPTIGGYLRYFFFGVDQFWPQFIPVFAGFTWVVFYWQAHHLRWSWREAAPLLAFASVLTAPYCWTYDQVILILPVIQAWKWLLQMTSSWSARILMLVYFLLNFSNLILHRYLDDFWFIWFAPAILAWFLAVRCKIKRNEHEILAVS
jgi:hypothetical protein